MKKLILFLQFVLVTYTAGQTLTQTNFAKLLVPQYMASGTTTRVPFVFRAEVQSLLPNTLYRYFTQAAVYSDMGGTNSGAGNPMLISQDGTIYAYTTGPSLSTANNYGTFITDGTGKYDGWFCIVNTGNARFTAGNYIIPTITIDSVNTGVTKYRYALNDSILVLAFANTAGTTNGTGIYGISSGTYKNIVALYDNVNGTGKPLSVTYLEDEGTNVASTVGYYTDSVNARYGRWGSIIPNTNSNGVRRIEQFSVSTGSSINYNTDADGIWPSGVNTINPLGGSTAPIRITILDAPLAVETVSSNVPKDFDLFQNFPNPFNPSTRIKFEIPRSSSFTLTLYDVLGRTVKELASGKLSAGTYEYELNASDLSSGIYFYKLTTEDHSFVKKLMLIK